MRPRQVLFDGQGSAPEGTIVGRPYRGHLRQSCHFRPSDTHRRSSRPSSSQGWQGGRKDPAAAEAVGRSRLPWAWEGTGQPHRTLAYCYTTRDLHFAAAGTLAATLLS